MVQIRTNQNSNALLNYAWRSSDLDYCEGWPTYMEFRLVYDGSLKASTAQSTRVAEKHAIRKQLHKQLATLYQKHHYLKYMATDVKEESSTLEQMRQGGGWFRDPNTTEVETFARRFTRDKGFRFVPLVNKEYMLVCGLDILFLRRENPGDLILRGGDVDNRIKTLLDALRIPEGSELPSNASPEDGEDPFFCLLENDSLVTDLSVTTDRLLRPLSAGENETNVVLVMKVHVKAARSSSYNLPLM